MIQTLRATKWNSARFGLVLAGGGAKGAYQAGVIQALYELDIADKVYAVSGTSVGALNTLAFALNRKELCPEVWENIGFKDVLVRADKEERTKLRQLWRELSAQGIRLRDFDQVLEYVSREGKSLFTQQGLKAMLERELDFAALRQSRPALYVCAYDIAQGRPEYFALKALGNAEIIQATLASCAIPYVFPPVLLRGKAYADGGINTRTYPSANADNTPLLPLLAHHLDTIIVVHLQPDAPDCTAGSGGPEMINLRPSASLEPVKGTGAMNFSRSAIDGHMRLGYRDTLCTLAPAIFSYLCQERPPYPKA